MRAAGQLRMSVQAATSPKYCLKRKPVIPLVDNLIIQIIKGFVRIVKAPV